MSALLQLQREVRTFYDSLAAHVLVPEQHYVSAYINDFLASISVTEPVHMSNILESFDAFSLAFFAMHTFPNAHDRVSWIERYNRLDVAQRRQGQVYHDYLTEGTSALRTIRSSLQNVQPPLGYF
jgi:hypothetical protein